MTIIKLKSPNLHNTYLIPENKLVFVNIILEEYRNLKKSFTAIKKH